MARSHNIYVVKDCLRGNILAAFTVKHELKTWLSRHPTIRDASIIYRCADGLDQGWPTVIPDNELRSTS